MLDDYDSEKHIMIARRSYLSKSLLTSFFHALLFQVFKTLENFQSRWRNGQVTLGADTFRWVSYTWPFGKEAVALWLERSGNDEVTFKVAGRMQERSFVRDMYIKILEALNSALSSQEIAVTRSSLATLPFPYHRGDELGWFVSQTIDRYIEKGERIYAYTRYGREYLLYLYFVDEHAKEDEVIPNLSALRLVRRTDADPPYLLHGRGYGKPPPSLSNQAKRIIRSIMRGNWAMSLMSRIFLSWSTLISLPQTKKRVAIMDLATLTPGSEEADDGLQLYSSLPNRNLYVPIRSVHSIAVHEFCQEVLRFLKALRAKSASIKASLTEDKKSTFKSNLGLKDQAGSQVLQVEALRSSDVFSSLAIDIQDESFVKPKCKPTDPYPLDDEPWFFLVEGRLASFHGLDFTLARDAVLGLKTRRMDGATSFPKMSLDITHNRTDTTSLTAALRNVNLLYEKTLTKNFTLKLECTVQAYNWVESEGGEGEWA